MEKIVRSRLDLLVGKRTNLLVRLARKKVNANLLIGVF